MDTADSPSLNFSAIPFGKAVGEHLYLHTSALSLLPQAWQGVIATAASIPNLKPDEHFNVIKLHRSGEELSLLHYPEFFDDPFPALARSWRINASTKAVIYRSYEDSRNPPILHRKELMLPPDDPRIAAFQEVTTAAESIGLFSDPNRIGFREHWHQLIAQSGYQLQNDQFIPVANANIADTPETEESSDIRRHLTALSRTNFSAPVQALLRQGLIDHPTTFFDYGCGRGDDVRGLTANGIDATGWDPHFAPEAEKRVADAVNIGFVINVIEDLTERVDALKGAFACTRGVLAVAAMLNSEARPEGRQYRDGFLSSRNTFQKYFTQAQLRDFIEHTLDENTIASGPGVFLVFRDKALEQRFLTKRYGQRAPTVLSRGWVRPRIERTPRQATNKSLQLFNEHRAMFDAIWLQSLTLGRPPESHEIDDEQLSALTLAAGSLNKGIRIMFTQNDLKELEQARASRMSDILVMLCLQQFQKRKPYKHLEPRLQRDIKQFFRDYSSAQASARDLLFSIGNLELIDQACRESSEKGLGWLEEGHSLQLHTSLVERLPGILRIYVQCAAVLYGDITDFDLVKIHIRSGKVTLMKFDNFMESPLPRLTQRVKVQLRTQDMDFFIYGGEYPPTLLYNKSRYINEEFPRYQEQTLFEESLEQLKLFDLSGYGPPEVEFFRTLHIARWEVQGFELIRSRDIPDLDEPCGRHLTYRDLIECGETQRTTGIANRPKEPDTYTALYELATKVLDPTIDYFGSIQLTYGFCSAALAKNIKARIAPSLDQHASHEKNNRGKFICQRLGAACDFLVEDEDMSQVARWVHEHTPCDRIYLYEDNRPIHVSYSSEPVGHLIQMRLVALNRRVPRVVLTRSEH
jgi:DNA phosphorothioation-associated putative methyltransferase